MRQLIGGVKGVGFKTPMRVLDKGRLHIAAVSVGANEMCGRVADRCAQIRGCAGYVSDYAIERF